MANEAYAEYAVAKVFEVTSTNSRLETELATIRTEQSLGAGVLPSPEAIVSGEHLNDYRSPILFIFAESGGPDDDVDEGAGQRNNMWNCDLKLALQYMSGVDLAAGRVLMMRYATAFIRMIRTYPTLEDTSGKINGALLGDFSITPTVDDRQAVWMTLEQDLEVRLRT